MAVRKGESRDEILVLGRLNARPPVSVDGQDGAEVFLAVAGGRKGCRGHGALRSGSGGRRARQRIDQRAEEELGRDHRGCRIAGEAEGERGGAGGKPGGLAWLHGNLLEDRREAFRRESGADDVIVADRGAADGDDNVARRGETLADIFFSIARQAEIHRDRAPAADDGEQGRLDRVDDLPRRNFGSRRHEFIAIGEYADAGRFRDDDLRDIAGGRQRDRAFAHDVAGRHEYLASREVQGCGANVLRTLLCVHHLDRVILADAVFLDEHVIGALRYDRAGEDANGLMISDLAGPGDAGAGFADHPQLRIHRHVGETDGVAIHRGHVGRRLVHLRDHGLGEAATLGGGERYGFETRRALGSMAGDQVDCLFDGGHADHRFSFSLCFVQNSGADEDDHGRQVNSYRRGRPGADGRCFGQARHETRRDGVRPRADEP
ncbi:MAG: hypothetical protein QM773_09525 [Hyphomonadaceae bacterium]